MRTLNSGGINRGREEVTGMRDGRERISLDGCGTGGRGKGLQV